MTSVYVTNVVKRVTVTPGAAGGAGGGTGTDLLPTNNVWTGTNTYSNILSLTPSSGSMIPLTVKGASGQSGALTEWKDSSNNILANVDSAGQISSVSNIYVGRGVSAGGGNKVLVLSNATAPTTNPTGGGILYALSGALKYRDSSGAIHMPVPQAGSKGNILVHDGTTWVKLAPGTNDYVLVADSAQTSGVKWAASSGSGHVIQDETTPLSQRTALNFTGSGVVVTDDAGNNRTNVTISGSGSSYYQTLKANGTPVTQQLAINFGSMFSVVNDSGNSETDVTVLADQAAGTASLRTLGTGATQAAAGTHTHAGLYESVGVASTLMSDHTNAGDPHPIYLTQTEADTLYALSSRAVPAGGTTGQYLRKVSGTDYALEWGTGSASLSIPYTAVGTSAGTVPFSVQGYTGQTANIFDVKNNSSTVLFGVTAAGEIRVGPNATFTGTAKIATLTNTTPGLVVRGATSQSANLIEARDINNAVVMSVSPAGNITAPNIGAPVAVLELGGSTAGLASGTVVLRKQT